MRKFSGCREQHAVDSDQGAQIVLAKHVCPPMKAHSDVVDTTVGQLIKTYVFNDIAKFVQLCEVISKSNDLAFSRSPQH